MSISVRMIAGVFMGVLVVMMMMSPAPALTIHPAVLKNFVGPFRKPGEPILQSTFFDRPRMTGERFTERNGHGYNTLPGAQAPFSLFSRQGANAETSKDEGQEIVYPAAIVRGPAPPEEWNRSLRSCKSSGSCGQNMDNTLNLLMRMMETGKKR